MPLPANKLPLLKPPFHFIGIGGSGMAPLAELLIRHGHKVSGSDLSSNESIQLLTKLGAKINAEHSAANIAQAKTVIYSSAVKDDNVELNAARAQNLTVAHRSDVLEFLMRDKYSVIIAGTHGKTTTSAITTHMLIELGVDPSAAIGGRMLNNNSSARFGNGANFVAEADESDGTLLKYDPFISVITSVDADHLDFFGDVKSIQECFLNFLKRTNPEGCCVIAWDDPVCRDLGHRIETRRLSYGFVIGSDVRAFTHQFKEGRTHFEAMVERDRVSCRLPLFGKHNIQNALCALAVARALELDVNQAAQCLETYQGVARRQSLVFKGRNFKIYDDYAHNPGKIKACITALRQAWANEKIVVVYQPHRYTRLETMYEETMSAFGGADLVLVLPVYSAGELTTQDFNIERLARDITSKSEVKAIPLGQNFEDIPDLVLKNSFKPGIIITVGAGDVSTVAYSMRHILEHENEDGGHNAVDGS